MGPMRRRNFLKLHSAWSRLRGWHCRCLPRCQLGNTQETGWIASPSRYCCDARERPCAGVDAAAGSHLPAQLRARVARRAGPPRQRAHSRLPRAFCAA